MTQTMTNGIVSEASSHSVDETVERLKATLQASGAVLFGLVDHSGEAEKVGLKMKPTKLLIFGNPKAGTPLMLAAPSTAMVFQNSCCQTYLYSTSWHPGGLETLPSRPASRLRESGAYRFLWPAGDSISQLKCQIPKKSA